MNGHRHRFDSGGLFEGNAIGKGVDDALRNGQELGKRAMPPVLAHGHAQHLAVVAQVDFAAAAEVAASEFLILLQ